MEKSQHFDLFMSLLGSCYVERGVYVDKSDIGGLYSLCDLYASEPFAVQRYGEGTDREEKYIEADVWQKVRDYEDYDKERMLRDLGFLFDVLKAIERDHNQTVLLISNKQGCDIQILPANISAKDPSIETALYQVCAQFAEHMHIPTPSLNPYE